ncbi:MAG: carbamate kinase [Verrucomicrobiales bacterium]|nr:carbamate kinase [Verrucomicrobiales bacterium]
MKVVIALGGNALLKRNEPLETEIQRTNIRKASRAVREVAALHEVILTHGNGPQVGLIALQAAACSETVCPYPLDVIGAQSEGMLGYMLGREIENQMPERKVVNLITETLVDASDPAFQSPTEFVGPGYVEAGSERLVREMGWVFKRDGDSFRRVVAAPMPVEVLEIDAIRMLFESGYLVICAGGGGVPVVKENGLFHGVEAVVNKDRTAGVLASHLDFDFLLMLTDVDGVYFDWGTDEARLISKIEATNIDTSQFEEGTIRPKIEAGCGFVNSGGRGAGIGSVVDALKILNGEAGTIISRR